jgi:prevent-host-death family protein
MKSIQASEFKAKCLKLMDEVAKTGEEVVITKNGKAISKLVPYRERKPSLFGIHADKLSVCGDILAPVDEQWNAEK